MKSKPCTTTYRAKFYGLRPQQAGLSITVPAEFHVEVFQDRGMRWRARYIYRNDSGAQIPALSSMTKEDAQMAVCLMFQTQVKEWEECKGEEVKQ